MIGRIPDYGSYSSYYDSENAETDEKRFFKVVQKNDLIQKARHSLNEKEMKLVDFCVSKIKDTDDKLNEIHTTLEEINKIMAFGDGGKNISTTYDALLRLKNKGFWIADLNDPDQEETTAWLKKAKVNKKTHECILEMDEVLLPYLIFENSSGHYTQYPLHSITQISGRYSLMLFKLMKSWSNIGGVSGEPKEFLEYFGKEKMTWTNFNKLYLKPAIEELNRKGVFPANELVYRGIKKGRYIKDVQLTLEPKLVAGDLPEVPIFDWLNEKKD